MLLYLESQCQRMIQFHEIHRSKDKLNLKDDHKIKTIKITLIIRGITPGKGQIKTTDKIKGIIIEVIKIKVDIKEINKIKIKYSILGKKKKKSKIDEKKNKNKK